MNKQNIQYMKVVYESNKKASVGATCQCPSCGTAFEKINQQQAFCKTKGKRVCNDKYWNNVTPTKRNNTTRISPASRAWLNDTTRVRGYTSEGYRIINGVAYDEFDEPMYDVDPNDDTHPFDVGDAGDKER